MSEKSKDTAKSKSSGFFARIGKFFREYRSELKKISWPTFAEVVKNTAITLAVVLIVGIVIWLFDWGISSLRNKLIDTFKGTSTEDTAEIEDFNDWLASATDAISGADEAAEEVVDEAVDEAVSAVDAALGE